MEPNIDNDQINSESQETNNVISNENSDGVVITESQKSPKSLLKKISAFVVILVLVGLGYFVYAKYIGPFQKPPAEILKQSFAATEKHFESGNLSEKSEINIDFSFQDPADNSIKTGNLSFPVSVNVNDANSESPKIEVQIGDIDLTKIVSDLFSEQISAGGLNNFGEVKINYEVKFIDDNLFIKINKLPQIVNMMVDTKIFMNKWIKIENSYVNNFASMSGATIQTIEDFKLTPEEEKMISEIVINYFTDNFSKDFISTRVSGGKEISINLSAKKLFDAIIAISKEVSAKVPKLAPVLSGITQVEVNEMGDLLESELGKINGNASIIVDREFIIKETKVGVNFEDKENNVQISVKVQTKISEESTTIEEPKDFVLFQTLMDSLQPMFAVPAQI